MGRSFVTENSATFRIRIAIASSILFRTPPEPPCKMDSRHNFHGIFLAYKVVAQIICKSKQSKLLDMKACLSKMFLNDLIRCKFIILDVAVVRGV